MFLHTLIFVSSVIKMSKLSPALIEKARMELNEIQSEVPSQIKSLREKIQDDPNRNFRTDDEFLLRFLRAEKFHQDKALELMISYYKQREYYPNLFRQNKSSVEKLLSAQMEMVLNGRDSQGRGILFATLQRWDPHESPMEDLIRVFLLSLEILIQDPVNQINGMIWVVDVCGPSASQVTFMIPKVQETASVIINNIPIRCKAIHYVRETPLFDGVYTLFRSFLNKTIQNKITLHGNDFTSLHEIINPKILPEEVGGELQSPDYHNWNRRVLEFYDSFVNDAATYGFLDKDKQGQ